MSGLLVPQGFRPIAVRDDRQGKCVISFNLETKEFYLVVNSSTDKPPVGAGPFTLNDLKQLVENVKDVIGLKGQYLFIEEYEVDGSRREE
jgi:hypothetical protein